MIFIPNSPQFFRKKCIKTPQNRSKSPQNRSKMRQKCSKMCQNVSKSLENVSKLLKNASKLLKNRQLLCPARSRDRLDWFVSATKKEKEKKNPKLCQNTSKHPLFPLFFFPIDSKKPIQSIATHRFHHYRINYCPFSPFSAFLPFFRLFHFLLKKIPPKKNRSIFNSLKIPQNTPFFLIFFPQSIQKHPYNPLPPSFPPYSY
jgi:hypothetical protein